MRRFCASYVESSLKRGGWNWVKSAKDNIGQGPRIIGSWSLEISLTKSHQRSGLKSQRILRDSLWNWVKSAKDTIGQREFCKIHIGNCPRPTVSDPQLWNFLKLNICNIYWVHFAQDFFYQSLSLAEFCSFFACSITVGAIFCFVSFVIRKSRRPYPWDSLQHYQLEVSSFDNIWPVFRGEKLT